MSAKALWAIEVFRNDEWDTLTDHVHDRKHEADADMDYLSAHTFDEPLRVARFERRHRRPDA